MTLPTSIAITQPAPWSAGGSSLLPPEVCLFQRKQQNQERKDPTWHARRPCVSHALAGLREVVFPCGHLQPHLSLSTGVSSWSGEGESSGGWGWRRERPGAGGRGQAVWARCVRPEQWTMGDAQHWGIRSSGPSGCGDTAVTAPSPLCATRSRRSSLWAPPRQHCPQLTEPTVLTSLSPAQ